MEETLKIIGFDIFKKQSADPQKSKKKNKVFEYDEKPFNNDIEGKESGFKELVDKVVQNSTIKEMMADLLKTTLFEGAEEVAELKKKVSFDIGSFTDYKNISKQQKSAFFDSPDVKLAKK